MEVQDIQVNKTYTDSLGCYEYTPKQILENVLSGGRGLVTYVQEDRGCNSPAIGSMSLEGFATLMIEEVTVSQVPDYNKAPEGFWENRHKNS